MKATLDLDVLQQYVLRKALGEHLGFLERMVWEDMRAERHILADMQREDYRATEVMLAELQGITLTACAA